MIYIDIYIGCNLKGQATEASHQPFIEKGRKKEWKKDKESKGGGTAREIELDLYQCFYMYVASSI